MPKELDSGNKESGIVKKENNDYLVVGKFHRPHGIRGDLLFSVITDFPERLKPGTALYVGEEKFELFISRLKSHNIGLIFGFKGIENPEAARRYVNKLVYVKSAKLPELPAGEYYHHQIIGMLVIDEALGELGRISEILITGANDVYVVQSANDNEILIPALKNVIKKVDLGNETMMVQLPEGLV